MDEEVSSALQRIADRLAAAIGRPVDLDDHHLRLLAHSSHSQQVDPVRLASIMGRSAPAPVTAHLRRIGVHEASGPLRVPAAPELGMDARLCIPIRAGETLLGFLWLLDDGEIDDPCTQAAVAAAAEAAGVLERARLARIGALQRAQSLVLDAVSEDPQRAAGALQRMVGEEMLSRAEGLHVAVAIEARRGIVRQRQPPAEQAAAAWIAEAVAAVRHATASGESVFALAGEEMVVLLALPGTEAVQRVCERLASECPELAVGVAAGSTEDGGVETRAGRGAEPGRPGGATADRPSLAPARERARWAAQVAARLADRAASGRHAGPSAAVAGGGERVGIWERLGPYRYLIGLERRAGTLGEIEPAVCALAQEESGRELLCTLECFLDLAGQARATATALNLHRSSLYHRLGRVEELLGIDLHDGVQRLDAHLAVKAARLQGLLGEEHVFASARHARQ